MRYEIQYGNQETGHGWFLGEIIGSGFNNSKFMLLFLTDDGKIIEEPVDNIKIVGKEMTKIERLINRFKPRKYKKLPLYLG